MSRVDRRTFVLARISNAAVSVKRRMLRLHNLQTRLCPSSHTTTERGCSADLGDHAANSWSMAKLKVT
jgi:hypothetical protein